MISLFAMLIVYCKPISILELWKLFSDELINAIKYKFDLNDNNDDSLIENLCLSEIQNKINLMNGVTIL